MTEEGLGVVVIDGDGNAVALVEGVDGMARIIAAVEALQGPRPAPAPIPLDGLDRIRKHLRKVEERSRRYDVELDAMLKAMRSVEHGERTDRAARRERAKRERRKHRRR